MPRRLGRPGLLGTMARTAVISGTATAVSGNVARRQMRRETERQAEYAPPPQATQYAAPPTAPPAPAAPAAPAGGASTSDRIEQLRELGELKAQGVLTEAEFAAEKARILQG